MNFNRRALLSLVVIGLLLLVGFLAWANWPMASLPNGTEADRIVVDKSERTLSLYNGDRLLKVYSISLGRVPEGAKEQEGDLKTPEGSYQIIEHFEPSAFHRSLRISYPGPQDLVRAQAMGVSPGSDIMIHGMRNGLGYVGKAHLLFDWTAGCIAVTNPEIEELWRVVPDGTVIEIME